MIDLDALSAKIHHESSWIDSPTLRDLDAAFAELRASREEVRRLEVSAFNEADDFQEALDQERDWDSRPRLKMEAELREERKEHRAAEAELHVLLDDLRAARKVVEAALRVRETLELDQITEWVGDARGAVHSLFNAIDELGNGG